MEEYSLYPVFKVDIGVVMKIICWVVAATFFSLLSCGEILPAMFPK
jgi:hypothetical protein